MFNEVIIVIIAYFIGSIPFGYLITKAIANKDIRKEGSGNIGATNVTRLLGKKWGIITFLFDACKGILAILIAQLMGLEGEMLLVVAYSSIIGHIAPIWFNFVGGKGVATSFAVLSLLMFKPLMIMLIIWVTVFKFSKISSLSAISAFIALPILVICMGYHFSEIIFSIILSFTILYKHKSNISRLVNRSESKF